MGWLPGGGLKRVAAARKTVSLTIEQASAKHTASGPLPTTDFVALGFLLPDSGICSSVAFQISQIA
jgi:hypothetical protein